MTQIDISGPEPSTELQIQISNYPLLAPAMARALVLGIGVLATSPPEPSVVIFGGKTVEGIGCQESSALMGGLMHRGLSEEPLGYNLCSLWRAAKPGASRKASPEAEEILAPSSGLPSLQSAELNKPLFSINYLVYGIQLLSQKMDQHNTIPKHLRPTRLQLKPWPQ